MSAHLIGTYYNCRMFCSIASCLHCVWFSFTPYRTNCQLKVSKA